MLVSSSVAEEIYRFKKGLASFGVLELLSKYVSDGIKHLMHVEVSVEDVKSCFVPCFSSPGFELHERETEIVYNWYSFQRSVSRGKLKCNVILFPSHLLLVLMMMILNMIIQNSDISP